MWIHPADWKRKNLDSLTTKNSRGGEILLQFIYHRNKKMTERFKAPLMLLRLEPSATHLFCAELAMEQQMNIIGR